MMYNVLRASRGVLLLFTLWIIGSSQPGYLLVFGFFVSLLIYFFSSRYLYREVNASPLISLSMLVYLPWLVYQMICSALYMLQLIYSPSAVLSLNNDDSFIVCDLPFNDESLNVLFANSVTLTPGTISVLVENGKMRFHSVTAEVESGIREIQEYINKNFVSV